MRPTTLTFRQSGPYRIIDIAHNFYNDIANASFPKGCHGIVDGPAVQQELQKSPLPDIPLDTKDRSEIRRLFQQVGCFHVEGSPAEDYAIKVFSRWRTFAQTTQRYDRYTFDWDHTLSNFKIVFTPAFGASLLFSKLGDKLFSKVARKLGFNTQPMTVVEVQRPFMGEMALGLMIGGALSAGLMSFEDWGFYTPNVSLATSTWKQRIDFWAQSCSPLLRVMGASSTLHLKDFLKRAHYLMNTCSSEGLDAMEPEMKAEALRYLKGLKAHHVKPEAVFTDHYPGKQILHFDDYLPVLTDLAQSTHIHAQEVHQPHTQTKFDLHKILPEGVFLQDYQAIVFALQDLIKVEMEGSTSAALLSLADYLDNPQTARPDLTLRHPLPEGVILTALAVQCPVGEFSRNFQIPIQMARRKIKETRKIIDYRNRIKTQGAP